MIAITLHEPWASAMATLMENGLPVKSIETREWELEYRGPIAIHAGKKKFDTRTAEPNFLYWARKFKLLNGLEYRLGCVLCIVEVIDCVRVQDIRDRLGVPEIFFGGYENSFDKQTGKQITQRYAWVTDPKKLQVLKTPVPATGHQKLWYWKPPEDLEFK